MTLSIFFNLILLFKSYKISLSYGASTGPLIFRIFTSPKLIRCIKIINLNT